MAPPSGLVEDPVTIGGCASEDADRPTAAARSIDLPAGRTARPPDLQQLDGRVRDQRRVQGGLRLGGLRQHAAVAVEVARDQRVDSLVGEQSEPFEPG